MCVHIVISLSEFFRPPCSDSRGPIHSVFWLSVSPIFVKRLSQVHFQGMSLNLAKMSIWTKEKMITILWSKVKVTVINISGCYTAIHKSFSNV